MGDQCPLSPLSTLVPAALLHRGESYRGREDLQDLPRTPAQGGVGEASEPWTRTLPKTSPQTPSHRSPQIQREGLTSARYSTQNFRSSDEPLGKKVRFALELATVSAVCWCIERCHIQRAVYVVLPGKRQRKKQAQGTGNSLEEMPLTN